MEAVEVVDEDGCLAEPLAVQLAPQRLAPAGFGDGQMQAVGVDAVPVFGGEEMAEGVFVRMRGDLGIACGAGGEEHEHRVVAARRVHAGLTDEFLGIQAELAVKITPAGARAADEDARLQRGALFDDRVDLSGNAAVCRTQHRLDAGGVEAVFKILGQQLAGGGDGHGAELVQAENGDPELIVPLEHEQHTVASLDTERAEVVGCARGIAAEVAEGEVSLVVLAVDVDHGQLVRLAAGQRVHHVEGKVEARRVMEAQLARRTALVFLDGDKLLPYARLVGLLLLCRHGCAGDGGDLGAHGLVILPCLLCVARDDHGAEQAVLAADGDHTVGLGAVVVDAVAGAEDLRVRSDLHLEHTGEHQVELVTGVGGQVDGLGLQILGIGIQHAVWLDELAAEHGGKAGDLDALLAGGQLALAGARDGIAGQAGGGAFQDLGHFHAEGQRALVQEGEGQILCAALQRAVFLGRQVGVCGHLLDGEAGDVPQLADALGNGLQSCLGLGVSAHDAYLSNQNIRLSISGIAWREMPGKNKKSPQRIKLFETSNRLPAVPLKLRRSCAARQAPSSPSS